MDIHTEIMGRMSKEVTRIDRSLFRLTNEKLVFIRYSKPHTAGQRSLYWFGFHKDRLNNIDINKLYIAFVCGSEKQIIVIPATIMFKFLENVHTATDDNWKIIIYKHQDIFELRLTGKSNETVTEYLNRFDLLNSDSESQETKKSLPSDNTSLVLELSIEDKILNLNNIPGDSVRDKLVEMVNEIGVWMGYVCKPNHIIRSDIPYYRLAMAWLLNDAIHIAVEVQIGENDTQVKDRLTLARRYGARKCVIVTNKLRNPVKSHSKTG